MAYMILKTEHGNFSYRGGPEILRDVGFEVGSSEILAILGPNGAGKTTLLRCVMDMLRWSSGASTLDGEDIRQIPARRLWSRMAYVPQARSAASSYTALQMVLLGRSSRIGAFSSPSEADLAIAEAVMRRLGIIDLADKHCHEISGGELQMVLIARAMAAEPEVLILDEPESNLDFRNQLVVLNTISELASEGMACVFNTHYPAHALQRADKSLILSGDGSCMFGRTSGIVTEENIGKAFGVRAVIGQLETPETVLSSVMPLEIGNNDHHEERKDEPCIASISVILKDTGISGKVNGILHEYEQLMIGRMGLPYRKAGLYIINVSVDGRRSEIEELTHRLSLIRGISVKTTYADSGITE